MRTGDRLRNLAKRGIAFSGIFETVFRHDDRVCPPAPFPHKPRPWPDAWTADQKQCSRSFAIPWSALRVCAESLLLRPP